MKKIFTVLVLVIAVAFTKTSEVSAQNNINVQSVDANLVSQTKNDAVIALHLIGLTVDAFVEISFGPSPNVNQSNSTPIAIKKTADTTIYITITGLTVGTMYSYRGEVLGGLWVLVR